MNTYASCNQPVLLRSIEPGRYLAIVSTEAGGRGGVTSVGSGGDSYDNALAESVIGLYKAELIFNCGRGDRRKR